MSSISETATVSSLPLSVSTLTLAERCVLIRDHPDVRKLATPADREAAKRWLHKLETAQPFDQTPGLWDAMLDSLQVDRAGFEAALAISQDTLDSLSTVDDRWRRDLEEALTSYRNSPRTPRAWPEDMGARGRLLTFCEPAFQWALARIRRKLRDLETSLGTDLAVVRPERVEELFLIPLAQTAYALCHRTLVLELNVCRVQGQLDGETPEQRFESYIERLATPEHAEPIYAEYAVLSRGLMESFRRSSDFFIDFLSRLESDRDVLATTFFAGQPLAELSSVSMSGDSHRHGKRVIVLDLEDGRKLVYKPRNMKIDLHFEALLDWFNGRGFEPELRGMRALDRSNDGDGEYGWAEFVAERPCQDEEELRSFYRRQGGLLAILYLMLSTDFHHENLIACGQHPILVDLESIFHPMLKPVDESQLVENVRSLLDYSVLRTALLPTRQFVGADETPYEVGGMSDVEGQQTPHATPYVNIEVADKAHIDRKVLLMRGSQNIPTLDGEKPDPSTYTTEIVSGFETMYQLILEQRDALLADDGPLASFAGDQVRFIFRHTRSYGLLASETQHPDLQRVALARDQHLMRLWGMLDIRPDASRLVRSEIESIWQGDIPFFTTVSDGIDLFDHEEERHPGHLARSCLDEVRAHLERMGEDDLGRQRWFVEGAMACQRIASWQEYSGLKGESYIAVDRSRAIASKDLYLHEAVRIGERLEELAVRGRSEDGEFGAAWLGIVMRQEDMWQFLPLGADLYNGLAGIILFLAHLARATGDRKWETLAREALVSLRVQQKELVKLISNNGAFTGWGGLIYLYVHLYALWREDDLLEDALLCARGARDFAEQDDNFEILYGNAGGLLPLSALYQLTGDQDVAAAMRASGDHILAHARDMKPGSGWVASALNCVPLAGLAHGSSGIALALETLYRDLGDERHLDGARQAIVYERSLFSEEHGNWKDMRLHTLDDHGNHDGHEPPTAFPVAWCNGSAGVGLTRMRLPSLRDETTRLEVMTSLESIRHGGFGISHCLCHGDLGNIELFLEVRDANWPELEAGEIDHLSAGIVAGIKEKGWICGTPQAVETPGLMTGLAGIGYGFLRLFDSQNTPSILLLDPPRAI
ncbi:MAG: type 2 lanthipeptide synthetase LanM family protein [Acidobacteriota bacterium]